MLHIIAFLVALGFCSIYAFSAGAGPERVAIVAQLGALLMSFSAGFVRISGGFSSLPAGLAVADLALGAALVVLALWANRFWPIALAGLQVATILAHIAKSIFPPLPAAGYAILVTVWAWPMLAVTAVGIMNHRRRVLLHGAERDWKDSWR
ncbi:hypothetical protein HMF7854_07090 [Sphingomonas ginkgonis]|uniref:Uncharacterized protein n=1 Tax=Sphingomonas ginkgonis TaxID=2315330 RepID=A0A3R9Z631_9SPHN|nr:hypothetical protein [Sphingomonas ginkgonis]RST30626.1 hypothetical protein HMF7854_07090 [Sphingomonas ginkgonis]